MKNGLDLSPNANISRQLDLSKFSANQLYYFANNNYADIQNLGSDIEKQRIGLIVDLIGKRKQLRDITIQRLDDLVIYCDKKILWLKRDFAWYTDNKRQTEISRWEQTIVDLEKQKISESKELFRDTLFLRNEWIKSILSYTEEKKLDSMLEDMIPSDSGIETKFNGVNIN